MPTHTTHYRYFAALLTAATVSGTAKAIILEQSSNTDIVNLDGNPKVNMQEAAATPLPKTQEGQTQTNPESQEHHTTSTSNVDNDDEDDNNNNPSDSPPPLSDPEAPMVYYEPKDYATWAQAEKARLLAAGEEAILQSEVPSYIPGPRPAKDDHEGWKVFAQRYSDTMNDMIRRGVSILNDQCTGDVVASGFHVGGRRFNLGEGRGVTKGEFRDFGIWFDSVLDRDEGEELVVPERWLKYEVSREEVEEEERRETAERRG